MKIQYRAVKYQPKNLYKVTVEFSHGDADGDSREIFEFRNLTKEQFEQYLIKFNEIENAIQQSSDLTNAIRQTIIARYDDESVSSEYDTIKIDEQTYLHICPDMFGGSEGHYARMHISDIVYYDENGQQYDVTFS